MPKKYTGHCACNAVRFEFDTDPGFVAVCHCRDCKRASGGEAAIFFAVSQDDFALLDGSPRAFRYVADSGTGLDRVFCPICGSRPYTENLDSFPDPVFVQLGSLDRPDWIVPKRGMFTWRRLPWRKALDLPQFEHMPN